MVCECMCHSESDEIHLQLVVSHHILLKYLRHDFHEALENSAGASATLQGSKDSPRK